MNKANRVPAPQLLLPSILIFLGFALRIFRLDTQSFSADEAFSIVNWTRSSFDYLFGTIALIDPQPPATLLSLYGWVRLVGDTEFSARMLSVLASLLTLATTYRITSNLFNRRTAATATIVMVITPFQIWYAQDARSYALWMAANSLSLLALLSALHRPQRLSRWLTYVIVTTLSIYTFYLELFFTLAQNIYVAVQFRNKPRLVKPWIASQLSIALFLAPWFLQPGLRSSGYHPTAGPANIPWAFETLLFGETIPHQLEFPLLTLSTHTLSVAGLISIILVLTGLMAILRTRNSKHGVLLLALYAIVPLLLLSALATATAKGYFRPRYIAAASMPLIVIVAAAFPIQAATHKPLRFYKIALFTLATLAIFIVDGSTLWTYFFNQSKAPQWRDITALLHHETTDQDLIIRNYPDPAFDYYYHGNADTTLLPSSENPPRQLTESSLEHLLPEYDYIWFMPVPVPWYDGEQIVAQWLQDNAQLVSEHWIGETHLLQYTSWAVDNSAIERHTSTTYSDIATLTGFRTTPGSPPFDRNTTIHLETFWLPRRQTETNLTLFVHLLGPLHDDGSPLWAQDDHPPQRGRIATHTWDVGKLFRDVSHITLPADAPPGEYTIAVGLYDPNSGDRIAVNSSQLPGQQDSTPLLTFTLPPLPTD